MVHIQIYNEDYWYNDIVSLFLHKSIFPKVSQSKQSKINSCTRLCIIVSLILLIFRFKYWWLFLIGSLILLYLFSKSKDRDLIQNYCDTNSCTREDRINRNERSYVPRM